MRRLARALALTALLPTGCSPATPEDAALRAYLTDAASRRDALLQALWFRDNGYARLRLARFATGRADAWETLPLWLPPAAPLRLGAQAPPAPLALALALPQDDAALRPALLRIGEAAFFDYPAQLVGGFELVAASPALALAYGLWRGRAPADPQGAAPRLGGLLQVALPGGAALALSCATCHARSDGDRADPGRSNTRLDIGALAQDQAPPGVTLPAAAWGPGRLDVSPDSRDNPAAIPDLRVVALQRSLHHDATLQNNAPGAAPLALALRIESLLITTFQEEARPPPALALGLALYLGSLTPPPAARAPQRSAIFEARCAPCHALPDGAGAPAPLALIGTDGALGGSPERGTGHYRVPTLRALADRGPLLHDGRVPDLAALLDPARLLPGYRGGLHGAGPVPGHAFGLDLSAADRASLAAFVSGL